MLESLTRGIILLSSVAVVVGIFLVVLQLMMHPSMPLPASILATPPDAFGSNTPRSPSRISISIGSTL